jgi:LacI family transcriptional regulator
VFAANDVMAIGCLAAFAERGLVLPRDIAVAGFDDIPLAAYVRPALTTMRVPIVELGRSAFVQLAAAIAQPGATRPAVTWLRPELVVRESCGASPRTQPLHPTVTDGGHDAEPRPRRPRGKPGPATPAPTARKRR